MSCRAKLNHKVQEKGYASLEFYKDGKPQYYCEGYIDNRTDELIEECKECPKHIYKSQADLEKYNNERNNK